MTSHHIQTRRVHARLAAAGGALGLVLLAAFASPASPASPSPAADAAWAPGDSARAAHLLNRATFGATPQDLADVLRMGQAAWLDRQLHPERIDDSGLEARLAPFPAVRMSMAELYRTYPPRKQDAAVIARRDSLRAAMEAGQMQGGAMQGDSMGGAMQGPARRRPRAMADTTLGAGPARIAVELGSAKLQRAVYSQRQLQEVMEDFWFNHFNVFFGKTADRWMVGDYERNAIRPFVFGKFEDMLGATAHHPAMLVYLDNWTSAVPQSGQAGGRGQALLERWRAMSAGEREAAVRSGRVTSAMADRLNQALARPAAARNRGPRGINENYARELMELHTLGVNGGYTQKDVQEVARVFTGWTVTRPRPGENGGEPAFQFRPGWHDTGAKTVLGATIPAGGGEDEGRRVLHVLATSPATAHHLAFELAQRFVADDPPASLVDRLSATFLRTGGDLREVTRELFTSPEFNDPRYRNVKVKTPFEFVASALRATGADAGRSRTLFAALRAFGQIPYGATPPTGYVATNAQWTTSGAMLNRMNFALGLASGRIDGVRLPAAPDLAARAADGLSMDDLRALYARLMPGQAPDEHVLQTIRDDLAQQPAGNPDRLLLRAAALMLGSPPFQRH
jgi:uncharacterized protein (DUF1800 family)